MVCILLAFSGRAALHAAAHRRTLHESSRRIVSQWLDAWGEALTDNDGSQLQTFLASRMLPCVGDVRWWIRCHTLIGSQDSLGYTSARKLLIALQRLSLSDSPHSLLVAS
jgi:hypothetical protein